MLVANNRRHRYDLKEIARRAMLARGFLPDFSPAVEREVDAVPDAAKSPTEHGIGPGNGVRDLRELLWASIDNDDSRDLDQLTVAEPLSGGAVKILVAIADVDALVHRGSAIDEHARHNTTSIYTAAETFPMLPERLSTDLTSLADRAERLAMIVEMVITKEGSLEHSDVYRAMVLNRAKLAYNGVAKWLDGQAAPPERVAAVAGMAEQLRVQDRVAQTLKERRHKNGALGLETLEPRAVFEGGNFAGLRIDPKNRAKELIEDFMVAANGVTARYLTQKGFPSVRRVLRSPKRWDRIVKLAADLGEKLPDEPSSGALEAFLGRQRRHDPTRFADLSLSVVKLMGSGEYALDLPDGKPPGHFGLAVRDYAHSTAPNRRLPDLITQRLLKAAYAGKPPPYDNAELLGLAQHCTTKEDDANKVERQVRKSAAALLLEDHIGERFTAIVTGNNSKGTWVRVCDPPVEGKVVRGLSGIDVGDRVQVELLSTDVERGYIDFSCVGR